MESRDWLVTDDGICHPCPLDPSAESEQPYRLYRFLSDLDDILTTESTDVGRLAKIRPLVRRLLTSSYWIQGEYRQPDPETGWSVLFLYQEPDYPITIQTVVWLPGQRSPIHNHGAWGVVALVDGLEKNQLWRRSPSPEAPNRIETSEGCELHPGDIISFTANAIHHVEVLGNTPTVSFNLYGETDFSQRFEFDPRAHSAKQF